MAPRELILASLVVAGLGCSSGSGPAPDRALSSPERGTDDRSTDRATHDGARLEAGRPVDGKTPASCTPITTFETGKTPTQVLHIVKGSNDSLADGSEAKPFGTLAAAAKKATAGTALRLHAGTYPGDTYLSGLSGTAGAPIWIGGAPGEARPLLQGGSEALHLSKARYVVIHDLEVSGPTGNGINCDDGGEYANVDALRYLVFRDLSIHDVGSGGNEDCLKLSGLNDYWVLDSTISKCGGSAEGSGIDHVGCHHGLIARNTFKSLAANAVQCKGGSEDIEIRANTMIDAGERAVNLGGSTDFTFFRPPLSTTQPNAEARNIRVVANLIQGGVAAIAFVGCVDCLAANNTIIDPKTRIIRILQETTTSSGYTFEPCSKGRFINNLVSFTSSTITEHVNIGPNTQPASFTFATNLWYAHDSPAKSQPTLPVAETGAVVGKDPALAGDFHISSSSPAATAGTTLTEVKADLAGSCYASPPSIGAYQAK